MFTSDTIAAISTPLGEGGIGIVRVSGPDAIRVVSKLFRSSVAADLPSHRPTLGRLFDPATNEPVDQTLLTLFRAPHSYTGEDVAEISGHGGIVVVRRVLELCLANGARLARPGEFTERAFLNGKVDLTQAEAVIDTIRAKSQASLRVAVAQLEGRLADRLRGVRRQLLELMAHIEATIDFPDDVDEPERETVVAALDAALDEIHQLLATAEAGRVYREGVAVAIAGKPNVGKSSLMNALLRDARAIVTEVPGTTRDLLEESLTLAGVPLRLVDTAGLRATEDVVERIGVERAREALADADIVLFVLDRSRPLDQQDSEAWVAARGKSVLPVMNKSDQEPSWTVKEAGALFGEGFPERAFETSMETGAGLPELETGIVEVALGGGIEPAQVMVSNVRHRAALESASASLTEARTTAGTHFPLDLVAGDVKAAAERLAEVTGESVTEDVITEIFQRFCVGK
jgi:tRNA modification GTPase